MAGLWRWRHNPVRRTTDLVEAWVALMTALLLVLGAPAVGMVCGALMDSSLQHTARTEQSHRHEATAVMIGSSTRHGEYNIYDPGANVGTDSDTRVIARWTEPGGARHVATVVAPRSKLRPGDSFPLWTDRHGAQASPPMNGSVAHFHAVFAGIISACVAVCLVLAAWRLTMWRLVHQRYKQLDKQWAQAGPDWGRTGTGS